jgi:hypothetical protein
VMRVVSGVNPVTKSVVRFAPEYTYETDEQRRELERKFAAYCIEQWKRDYRSDPLEVNPYAILRGEVVADAPGPLHEALWELLAKYGATAVQAALTDLRREGNGDH